MNAPLSKSRRPLLALASLTLLAARAAAQVFPDSVRVDFGTLANGSALRSLWATDGNPHSIATATESGSSSQVGAFLGTFPIPAGTVSAVTHVTTSVSAQGRRGIPQGGNEPERRALGLHFYPQRAYAEYTLPSPNSMNMGTSVLSFKDGAFVSKIPNSLCAYVGVTAQGPNQGLENKPKTSYQVDAGVCYYPTYNGFPSRYSPILRIWDGRDCTVQLTALNPSTLNWVQYGTVGNDDQAYATMRYVIDRSPKRLVTFRIAIFRVRNYQFALASTCALMASAPAKTSINPNVETDVAIAKNVISLAQNKRRQQTPTRYTTSQPPAGKKWSNAFYPDTSYATGASVTRERLIDGYDSPDPDNLNHRRDVYGSSVIYVSTGQAKATNTSGGIEPVTIVNLKHTTSGP